MTHGLPTPLHSPAGALQEAARQPRMAAIRRAESGRTGESGAKPVRSFPRAIQAGPAGEIIRRTAKQWEVK